MRYLIGKTTREWSPVSNDWRYYRKIAYITRDGDLITQFIDSSLEEDLELKTDHFIKAIEGKI